MKVKHYIQSGGEIVHNGESITHPRFDYMRVWSTTDDETINIDVDCDKESEFKDSFNNISLSIEDAELLILRLQQEVANLRKKLL